MAKKTTRLDPKIVNQIRLYRQILDRTRLSVTQILIFGSQAKGTAHPDSDIDLAVISPKFGKDYHRELVRLLKLVPDDLYSIEPHPMHPRDLNDRWNAFAFEVKKYGIPVK